MNTMQVTLNTTISTRNTIRIRELKSQGMQLVCAALCLPIRDSLALTAPVAWDEGLELLDNENPRLQDLGVLYLLRILSSTPNTASAAASQILAELARYANLSESPCSYPSACAV